jgi:hypothetical protein
MAGLSLSSSFPSFLVISCLLAALVLNSNPPRWNPSILREIAPNRLTRSPSHKIKKMLVHLFWSYKNISPDFITDYLVQGGDNPKPTVRNDRLRLVPRLHPTFVVMSCQVKERCFKSSEASNGTCVCYDFVLMDGSKTLFSARLNSGLSKQLHRYNVFPGASMTITDYDIIPLCHEEDEPIVNRMVMFIKGFSWTTAPAVNTFAFPGVAEADDWTTDTFQKAIFDFYVVRSVETIRMFNYGMDKRTGRWHYSLLHETGVRHGYWIRHEETKRVWQNQLEDQKRKANTISNHIPDSTCTCKEHYDLCRCILASYPISKVCKIDIYSQVAERIGLDNVDLDEFDGFTASHKCWSL